MSGGSYNYVCFANDRNEVAPTHVFEEVRAIASRLAELGYDDAAIRMAALCRSATRLREEFQAMEEVMQAVEWFDSSDWSQDTVSHAVNNLMLHHARETCNCEELHD